MTQPTRVGVIGGGQLARMMIPAAINLGLTIKVLAETEGMSAELAANQVGDYHDLDAVLAFADTVDVITFDHEHVPQPVLRELVARGIPVHPGPDALLFAQDKLLMRQKLTDLGLPMPEWARIQNPEQLAEFLASHGGHAVVKTPRGGYDGHGVRVVAESHEVDDWFEAAAAQAAPGAAAEDAPALLVEELVDFRRELAQQVARRPSGELVSWPVVETIQRNGVCAEVIAPAPPSAPRLAEVAAGIATTIATGIGVTGVLAVELFETTDDRLLVNELAMRPHNSGHWSIDGSVTSQFEQHLRAVLDLPLGATGCRDRWSVMVNILGGPASGALQERYPAAMAAHPTAKFHAYGKEPRPGRKVGHITVSGDDLEEVVYRARGAAGFFQD
ncbi:MAG: 5-(carboxyamino)imidazole ribonucleotide synthase [Microbacteriaceae bacterium]